MDVDKYTQAMAFFDEKDKIHNAILNTSQKKEIVETR